MVSPVLEFDAALADGVGQGLDPAVVLVMAAVEGDLGDALGLGGLGELSADGGGRLDVAAVCGGLFAFAGGGGGGQRDAGLIVNDLGVNVHRRAEHAQP